MNKEAWDPLGYARLSDYAAERLGLSARWVRSLALVGKAFRDYPRLEEALASGALAWTKVRLLASLPPGQDEAAWLARASQVTAAELAKLVRAVDRGSLEGGVLDDDAPVSRLFEVRCTPEVRWKWNTGRHAARRVAGRMCSVGEAAEVIAAEVLSAIPADEIWERETRTDRTAALSWVKAEVLVPMVSADPLGRFMAEWVVWAGQVTVRRLREDVEWALTLADTDPVAFRLSGGLPAGDREIGAQHRDSAKNTPNGRSDPAETCTARFIGPAEVVQLFRAVLCTVRRRIEKETGRLPTEGHALGVILDHVFECWGIGKGKTDPRHGVFERDGWLCTVPGCTSMRNLHSHHIRFRSAGGTHGPENRTSLCAFHHLRGVHAGRLRCTGRAPDGLTWQMGIRPGAAPLATYRSGDIQV